MPTQADALLDALRAVAVPARAEGEKRYLRSSRIHLGASMPAIRKVARTHRRAHPDLPRAALLALCDDLWARGIHEGCMLAVELLDAHQDTLAAADLAVLERYLRDAHTWAIVDSLAASVAGPLVERFPRLERTLDRWARDEDFWIRRSALLAFLLALREGRGDLARFGRLAEPMLEEREFFIRKAIGWVLRDTSRRRPREVAAWLLPRAARASGLTVREATKHLPPRDRAAILKAHAGAAAVRRPRTRAAARP
ncbi:MAG: DNA alkylation repair protein [Anaeromyxobacteraceae bacterium]